jgi:RNA polymerase sigma-70 factor (ECF subfamily)
MDLLLLFQAERANLVRFLRRFGGAVSAEDVTQETFLQLMIANTADVRSPRAYLFTTARNVALLHLKRARALDIDDGVAVEGLQAATTFDSPEALAIAREEVARLQRAIALLPEQQRRALLLRRVERLAPGEVAQRLGVTERQVQRLVAQAVASCHASLHDTGDSDASLD